MRERPPCRPGPGCYADQAGRNGHTYLLQKQPPLPPGPKECRKGPGGQEQPHLLVTEAALDPGPVRLKQSQAGRRRPGVRFSSADCGASSRWPLGPPPAGSRVRLWAGDPAAALQGTSCCLPWAILPRSLQTLPSARSAHERACRRSPSLALGGHAPNCECCEPKAQLFEPTALALDPPPGEVAAGSVQAFPSPVLIPLHRATRILSVT